MKFRKIFSLPALIFTAAFGQQISPIVLLANDLNESSGLLFINQKIITHNDSQGLAALFEVDTLTGQKSRTVVVANASNVDWEDLANDDTYLYIGDFGNNMGNRTDLKIYKIALVDYWNTTNDTIFADTIHFSFGAQTNFSAQPNATNWDCEAMTVIGDSLYLFTKNWTNQKTNLYVLPKNPGYYALQIRDSLSIQGLITSADFNLQSNRLVLAGNTPFSPFVVEIDWNSAMLISQMSRNRYTISVPNSIQVEAIVHITENDYYLSSESFSGKPADLMRLNGKNGSLSVSKEQESKFTIYPNPSAGIVQVEGLNFAYFTIHSLDGREIYRSKNKIENLRFLPAGYYRVAVYTENGLVYFTHLILD